MPILDLENVENFGGVFVPETQCNLTCELKLKLGVWIVVNNIKLKLSKHLLCGFLYQRMQDVEEMTLRFSNFYSFMWLVTVLSYVAFGNPAPARFGHEGT